MTDDRDLETGKAAVTKKVAGKCEWFDPPPGQPPVIIGDDVARLVGNNNYTKDSNGNRVPGSSRVSGESVSNLNT